jgi:hypothetical protein
MSPVRRVNVHRIVRRRPNPATENMTAGKRQRVRAVVVDHSKFQVTAKRGALDRHPNFGHRKNLRRSGCHSLIHRNDAWP